ncbi:MAG TPA: hypothetical protein PLX89_10145 [Verrucomicrobiota bacterium]|nr:hypothetical protein [Verrucomicrobiota bacterium]
MPLDVVAVNKLGESVRRTTAIAGNRIYVRSADHLGRSASERDT